MIQRKTSHRARSLGIVCGILLSGTALAETQTIATETEQGAATRAEPVDWRAVAVADIEAVYAAFKDQHPGFYDAANPDFREKLEQARARGLAFAAKVTKPEDYAIVTAAFSSVLRDGHALIAPSDAFYEAVPDKFRWPGFIANWRGNGMFVTKALPEHQALVGSQIVECDGEPIRDLIQKNVFALFYRPDEPGQWWRRAHNLFLLNHGNGLELLGRAPPSSCVFAFENGGRDKREITFSEVPEAIFTDGWFRQSFIGETSDIGLTEPRPGIFLIGLPDFQPGPEGKAAYEKLFADLAARHEDLGKARAIFIDMRGNGGGSSAWSKRVAELLWGDAFIDPVMDDYHSAVSIHWRNTPAVREKVELYAGTPGSAGYSATLARLAEMMRGSDPKESPLIVEPESSEDELSDHAPPRLANVPVYVANDGGCASACNDALDVFTRFPGTRLIGAPSSADSTYLEVRVEPTASGYGTLVLPMKIWVDRPVRPGPSDTYAPDIAVTSADWSTARFLDLIEQDLAAAGKAAK